MIVAPIIHTRTFYNDFLSNFLVRPDYFTSRDIDWARRFIRASTTDIDLMKGERYVVIDNGNLRIAGIVTITANLSEKTNHNISKHYFCDDKGRNIYAFIGICAKSPLQSHISITNEDFIKIFEKYVIPVFDYKISDTQSVLDEIELEKSSYITKPTDIGINLNNCTIYESTIESDKKWFDYYINCKKQNFSFCSNMSKYQTIKECVFDCITTTPNNIKRLEHDMPSINRDLKEKAETDYKQFKEKYHDRILKEFEPEIKQKLLQNPEFIQQIRSKPKIIESVIKELYNEKITETEHYSVKILGKLNRDILNLFKKQKCMIIIEKESNNVQP